MVGYSTKTSKIWRNRLNFLSKLSIKHVVPSNGKDSNYLPNLTVHLYVQHPKQ